MPFDKMDSEELRELLVEGLESGHVATLKFFRRRLKAACRSNPRFSDDQTDYIADMLSRFALKAIQENFLAADRLFKIKEVYQFLSSGDIKETGVLPPNQIENMACQILFLSSFDEKNFLKKMSANQVDRIGSYFFLRSAAGSKKKTLMGISDNFKIWREHLAFLEYQLTTSPKQTGLIQLFKDSIQLPKVEK